MYGRFIRLHTIVSSMMIFGFIVSAQSVTCPVLEAQQAENLETLVRQSTFIFLGTVTKLRAATMSIVPASSHTVVVRVDDILQVPDSFGDYRGNEISVYVENPDALTVGTQKVFFAKGWLLGQGVAVQEVGELPKQRTADLREQILTARQRIEDEDLQARLARAQLVVLGKVAAVRDPGQLSQRIPSSEHDPEWREATVEIETVLKGQFKAKSVAVLFPSSRDIIWVRVPKFAESQEGIWILSAEPVPTGPARNFYTALDPLDFQPKNQLGRINALLAQTTR